MKTTETLPRVALFEPDGHLGEAALACIADGELELVAGPGESPSPALAHLERCERCSHRLGEAALLSLAATDALAPASAPALAVVPLVPASAPVALAPAVAAPKPRRPLPWAAIAAAIAIAIVTAGPSFVDGLSSLHATVAGAIESAPFLARIALAIARAPWAPAPVALAVKLGSAALLMMIGLRVARTMPRHGSWQEGGMG